jgi:hypothetical protein
MNTITSSDKQQPTLISESPCSARSLPNLDESINLERLTSEDGGTSSQNVEPGVELIVQSPNGTGEPRELVSGTISLRNLSNPISSVILIS